MDEQEFMQRADQALTHIESALEALAVILDYDVAEYGLEMDFQDGSQIVLTRHIASREIWVAAKRGGFHFYWDGEDWRDRRSGKALLPCLGELASEQAGRAVCF
jgi:CyaY protein